MPYHMAWRIGWSFLWRRTLWIAALALCIVPFAVRIRHWELATVLALAAAVTAVEAFLVHPLVVQSLPNIRYRDFRLAIVRRDSPPDDLRYREALLLSIGPSALLVLCDALAAFQGLFLLLMIVYPAAAWLLTYPWTRCRLEVVETLSPYGPAIP